MGYSIRNGCRRISHPARDINRNGVNATNHAVNGCLDALENAVTNPLNAAKYAAENINDTLPCHGPITSENPCNKFNQPAENAQSGRDNRAKDIKRCRDSTSDDTGDDNKAA